MLLGSITLFLGKKSKVIDRKKRNILSRRTTARIKRGNVDVGVREEVAEREEDDPTKEAGLLCSSKS